MKKYILIGLLTLIAASLWNCEKDDLCPITIPTTPRVVIEFYDFTTQTELKNVTNLVVEEFGTDSKLVSNSSITDTDDINRYLFNTNKIYLPLRTNVQQSKFNIILNNGAVNEETDVLTFDYTKEDIYISRACGYRTIFDITNSSMIIPVSPGNWIKSITVVNTVIENENETHVKIFF